MARKNKSTEYENGHAEAEGTPIDGTQPTSKTISIGDFTFSVPAPYKDGHVCNAIEAGVLNQTLSQNLRNNFAPHVKKAQEAAQAAGTEVDKEALSAKFDEYANSYEFAERRAGRGPIDPVEREALVLAKATIRAAATQQNLKIEDAEVTALATRLLADPDASTSYYDEAKRRVAARKEITSSSLDLAALQAQLQPQDGAEG